MGCAVPSENFFPAAGHFPTVIELKFHFAPSSRVTPMRWDGKA
jgi:hypothetical protein